MIDGGVLTTLLTVLGGIVTAYITVSVRKKKPAEYVDVAFDNMERLLKRADADIIKKDSIIAAQAEEIRNLRAEIARKEQYGLETSRQP